MILDPRFRCGESTSSSLRRSVTMRPLDEPSPRCALPRERSRAAGFAALIASCAPPQGHAESAKKAVIHKAMKIDILASAAALSDHELLARLDVLAQRERDDGVELLAHLAALDTRPSLYASLGYGTLFSYCTEALRFSEDVACNRIVVARACRRYPGAPRPVGFGRDDLSSIRRIAPPSHAGEPRGRSGQGGGPQPEGDRSAGRGARAAAGRSDRRPEAADADRPSRRRQPLKASRRAGAELASLRCPYRRQATAPARYRVQFTIGETTHEKLRRLQGCSVARSRAAIPRAIFDLALGLLFEKVEKAKLGRDGRAAATQSIRRATDKLTEPDRPSRHVPSEVKRAVWQRDGGAVRVRGSRRTQVHRAHLPGVPPPPALREARSGHRRQHRAPLPPPQPIRGRPDLRRAGAGRGSPWCQPPDDVGR